MDFVELLQQSIEALNSKDACLTYRYELDSTGFRLIQDRRSYRAPDRVYRRFKNMDSCLKFAWSEVQRYRETKLENA